jgi:hypothetical protein
MFHSMQPPLPGSARLYAGGRSVRRQVSPELVSESSNYSGYDIIWLKIELQSELDEASFTRLQHLPEG